MAADNATERRLERLDGIHSPGGACEDYREAFWKEITRLKASVSSLDKTLAVINLKLWIGGLLLSFVGSVLGTVAVQLILNWINKK